MLKLDGLVKDYPGVRALDGCTLSVASGTMLGFLGPNGAGKTTAMRSIFGLVRPDSGRVTWNDEEVGHRQSGRFGYMPEQRGLYPRMRVHDQLVYLGEIHGMTAAEADVASHTWLDRLGLSDRAGDRLEELSHGNQQRIQLAAALVHDPELLVLDEPFSGLDPLGVEMLGDVLRGEARRGKAVIFSSHQLDLVEGLCQDVAIINKGRVVVDGEVAALKEQAQVRRLEIHVKGASGAWIPDSGTIIESSIQGDRVSMVVDRTADLEEFLQAASAAGTITHMSFEPPSLSELFLAAVRQ